MTSSESHPASRTFAGRYQVGSRHGAGVEAATFDAVDVRTGAGVALRLVHPDLSADEEFARSFHAAMERAAEIQHPNVAQILSHGADVWNGRRVLYVASEYLSGGSLRDLLDRGRLLSPSQGLMIGLEACKGLDAIHRSGLLHGEIRPATLIFGDDSRLRIVDAGLSQAISGWIWSPDQQPRQELAMYAAPERSLGEEQVPKSDVYSLALTIVEAVTGRLPFVGENATATLSARVDRLLPVSADLGALAAVLERGARPVAEDRYDAVSFGKALMQTASRLPRPAPIPTLAGGLFADRAKSGDTEAPTGPVTRPAPAVLPPDDEKADEVANHIDDEIADQAAGHIDHAPGDEAAELSAPDELSEAAADASPAVDADADTEALPAVTPPPVDSAVIPPPVDSAAAPPPVDSAVAGPRRPTGSLPPPSSSVPLAPDFRPGGPTDRTEAIPVSTELAPAAREPELPRTAPAGVPAVAPTVVNRPVPTADPTRVMPTTRAEPATVVAAPAGPTALYDEGPVRRRRVPWWVYPLVLLILAGGAAGAWFLSRTPTHTVPDLVGMAEPEARNQVSTHNWTVVVSNEPYDCDTDPALQPPPADKCRALAPGQVIRTEPPAGERLAEKKTLTLLVSSGPAPRVIPDMVGRPYSEVEAELTGAGLVVERDDDVFDENVPKGSVVKFTVPESPGSGVGSTVNKGTTVVLTVSAGPAPRDVPQLVRLTTDVAKAQLEQLGLTMTELPEEFSNDVPAGQIVRQEPTVGEKVERGATVSVAVSKGPDLVVVPTVTGLDAAGIKSALESVGFVVGAIGGDETQPLVAMSSAGTAVTGGQQLLRGSTIDLEFAPTPTTTTTTVPESVPPAAP